MTDNNKKSRAQLEKEAPWLFMDNIVCKQCKTTVLNLLYCQECGTGLQTKTAGTKERPAGEWWQLMDHCTCPSCRNSVPNVLYCAVCGEGLQSSTRPTLAGPYISSTYSGLH